MLRKWNGVNRLSEMRNNIDWVYRRHISLRNYSHKEKSHKSTLT